MSLIQPPNAIDAVPVELLFRFEALVGPMKFVPGAPYGDRGVLAVTGGFFEGPRLRGEVVGGVGGEFATVRANGTLKAGRPPAAPDRRRRRDRDELHRPSPHPTAAATWTSARRRSSRWATNAMRG